ncbi:unnamed protein product [Paramecium sonneborni]|uniref:Ubiquitin-like domain-containing protein n=1 Tax=Paramecium sonneborni TaxID=65129 RepID=A0A8S1M3Q5_9CILI|nr:unnamed protein product [Paramecium sonneborni]
MELDIQIFGKRQRIQISQNSLVKDVINKIIREQKLMEQNQQLALFLNGKELQKELKILQQGNVSGGKLELKQIQQPQQQLLGIKLVYNNEIKIVYVQNDYLVQVLYVEAESQFYLQKDQFRLMLNEQDLNEQILIKNYSIDASSQVLVKKLNQLNKPELMIELRISYQKETKIISINIYCQVFELEQQIKKSFNITQDICIFSDKIVLQQDQKLIDITFNNNKSLLVLQKEVYQGSLKYVEIFLEYKGVKYPFEVSDDTLIQEIIILFENQQKETGIGLKFNSNILPLNQSISTLNIQQNSTLIVFKNQIERQKNNVLKINLRIAEDIQKIEVDPDTLIEELICQIENNNQIQKIELVLENGTILHRDQTFKYYNLQNEVQIQVRIYQHQQYQVNNQQIQFDIEFQGKRSQYKIPIQTQIYHLENCFKNQLKIQNQIYFIFQGKKLNSNRTLHEEGIKDGSQLICEILYDKKIIPTQPQENPGQRNATIKVLDNQVKNQNNKKFFVQYKDQVYEFFGVENILVSQFIQSIKNQFKISHDINLFTKQGIQLQSQNYLYQYNLQDKEILFIQSTCTYPLKLTIKYQDRSKIIDVNDDTLGRDLNMNIKQLFQIKHDIDLIVNRDKLNPHFSLKQQNLKNNMCLEVQEKKIQIKDISQQQSYPQKEAQQQYIQQQNHQMQQQPQVQQQFQHKLIKICEVQNNQPNQINKKEHYIIILQYKQNQQQIELDKDVKINEIADYIKNVFEINHKIKLTCQGKILQDHQTLEEIGIDDNNVIIVE